MGYSLVDIDTDLMKKTSFTGSIGLGIDLSENFTLIGSYGTQLSNSSNMNGIKIKGNAFGASLLYKF